MIPLKIGIGFFMIFSIWAFNAFADLGDTVAQCDALYGSPKFTDASGSRGYLWNGYALMVDFTGGNADTITYRKADHDAAGTSAPISEAEINQILQSTHPGWRSAKAGSGFQGYLSTDGKLGAAYDPINHILTIGKK